MFVRNGEALGSVLHTEEPKAAPKPKPVKKAAAKAESKPESKPKEEKTDGDDNVSR